MRKRLAKRLRHRKFRAYCVGAPRTGTTSISGLFKEYYRSGHEVDPEVSLKHAFDYREAKIDHDEFESFVIKRDETLFLEMDSSNHNYYLVPIIVNLFPDAKFLIPIRDVLSWVDSYVDYGINNRLKAGTNVISPQRTRMNNYRYENLHKKYSRWDAILETYDMPSIEAHLLFYQKHYDKLLKIVPEDRRYVYRTDELIHHIHGICRFLKISPTTLNTANLKLNQRGKKHGIVAKINPVFLQEKVDQYCGHLMRRYFPEMGVNSFRSA